MMFPIKYNGDILSHNARVGVDGGIVESLDFVNDFSEQTKRVNIPSSLPLDLFPNAEVAYSLRKLSSTYTGSAVRIRRVSDNSQLDIGFDSNGNLDTTTLSSFVGASSGTVSVWYDQSGNNKNMTQTASTSQPVLVSGGTTLIDKNRPIINFDGVNNFLVGSTNTSQIGFVFAVYNTGLNGQFRMGQSLSTSDTASFNIDTIYDGSATTNIRFLELTPSNSIFRGNTNIRNSKVLSTYSSNGSSWTAWVNSNLETLIFVSGANSGNWFGDYQYNLYLQRLNRLNSFNSAARVQEIIIYNSNQSTNRTAIESNINSYYQIY